MTHPDIAAVTEREWDAFAATCPDASAFSSSQWLRLAASVFGGKPQYLIAGDGAAGAPLLIARRGPLVIASAVPITLYNGMLVHDASGASRTAITALLARIERTTHFATLGLPIGSAAAVPAADRGWERISQQTVRIPIGDVDATWRGFSQSLRRKIRRADDAGLTRIESPDMSIITGMHEESYARHRLRPPISATRLRGWMEALHGEGLLTQHIALDADGRPRAARATISDNNVLYDWLAGMGDGTVHLAASHWLVWEVISGAAAAGHTTFDFMGANTPGISDFKFLFGGVVMPYDVVRFRRSRAVRWFEQLKVRVTTRRRLRG